MITFCIRLPSKIRKYHWELRRFVDFNKKRQLNFNVDAPMGVAFFVALYSALKKKSIKAATIVLGDLAIQGNIKALASVQEPQQIGMDNGARKACIPIGNKRHFLEVPGGLEWFNSWV